MAGTTNPESEYVHSWKAVLEVDPALTTTSKPNDEAISLQDSSKHTKNYAKDYYYGLPAPNDPLETPRLNLQHDIFKLTIHGRLHLAPLQPSSVHRILDTCTGTGIWAKEAGRQYPNAQVLGVDLTPVDTSQAPTAPSNVSFSVQNIEEDWHFTTDPSSKFDFIHGRMIVVAVTDWPSYLRRAFAALKPGGWLEIQDLSFPLGCSDGTVGAQDAIMQWGKYMVDANHAIGRVYGEGYQDFPNQFAAAGFTNYHQEMFAWALNTWPKDEHDKEIAALNYKNTMDGMESFTNMSFKKALGWSQERIDDLVQRAKADVRDLGKHSYFPIKFIWAQKPE